MSKRLGELTVRRKQQQSFGVIVQSADGKQSRFHVQQIQNGFSALVVLCRADDSLGLVKHNVNVAPFGFQSFAVQTDCVVVGIYVNSKLRDRFAVYLYSSLSNNCVAAASACHSAIRKIFVQPHLISVQSFIFIIPIVEEKINSLSNFISSFPFSVSVKTEILLSSLPSLRNG